MVRITLKVQQQMCSLLSKISVMKKSCISTVLTAEMQTIVFLFFVVNKQKAYFSLYINENLIVLCNYCHKIT